jgi:peptidoglycan/LPS O-acetylase OafA/YrhL
LTQTIVEPIAPVAGRYVPAIDGLRAIAVLAVIAFHLRPGYLPGGFAGVDLFFVVSGFVVTSSLARRHFSRMGELLAYFYARRMIRILPALLAMLVVTALLTSLFMNNRGLRASFAAGISAFFGLSNLVLAASGENYFAPEADLNPFLHTWTLGVEEQFYLASHSSSTSSGAAS